MYTLRVLWTLVHLFGIGVVIGGMYVTDWYVITFLSLAIIVELVTLSTVTQRFVWWRELRYPFLSIALLVYYTIPQDTSLVWDFAALLAVFAFAFTFSVFDKGFETASYTLVDQSDD